MAADAWVERAKLLPVPNAADRDRWAVTALLRHFTPATGRWRTPTGDAWQPALAIEAVINSYDRTRETPYLNVIEKSFAAYRGRRSHFFDDDGWYLNAWLRGYDVTADPKYLTEARAIFETMTDGWDLTCSGGVWWNRDRTYKNAITNELFLLAAARLHRRTGEPSYLDWAQREWAWFEASGLINAEGLVNDGLDGDCRNNGQPTWTYNQGVVLSGLVELARTTEDPSYLDPARRIADAATRSLVNQEGTLREHSEPAMDNKDSHIFKGVLAQGLARLAAAEVDSAYGAFLSSNAAGVWDRWSRRRRGVGLTWGGPAGRVTAATHASACLLLGHVALLDARGEADVPSREPGRTYTVKDAIVGDLGTETHDGRLYAAGWFTDGQYVAFPVEVRATGEYVLTLTYAAAGDAWRSVEVEGVTVAERLLFAGRGGWECPSTVSITARLRAGDRTVTVLFNTDRGSRAPLNVASLTLTPRSLTPPSGRSR